MRTASILALAGTALGAAIPDDPIYRTPVAGPPAVTRSFELPQPPFETGVSISWGAKHKRALDAEALEVAEFYAEKRAAELEKRGESENFGDGSPAPGTVQILGMTYGGTGCPSYTVGSAISADLTTMTLIFDQYVASIGPKVAITESRKNCQLNLNLLYPGGFQYSIFSADYRGYAYLDPGISGKQQSIYYFSGQTAQVRESSTVPAIIEAELTRPPSRSAPAPSGRARTPATTSSRTRPSPRPSSSRRAAPTPC